MRTAMQNLRERWGLSNSEIARALNISERQARLARDGSTTADGADTLDEFMDDLAAHYIKEPAAWMSKLIVEGYTAARWDLYVAGRFDLLKANATREIGDEAMLDMFNPDWRRTYWTSFKTVEAEDGGRSIVGKSYDDVVQQVGVGGR